MSGSPDPVREAFEELAATSGSSSELSGRIRESVRSAPQLRRSRTVPAALAAAAAVIVAVIVVSSPLGRTGLPRPSPAATAAAPTTAASTADPTSGPSINPVAPAPDGLQPNTIVRARREFSIWPFVTVETGQSLFVVAGPTDHAGVPSYLLQFFGDLDTGFRPGGVTGWVAAAEIDELVVPRNPICPTTMDLRDVARLLPFEQVVCLGWPRELTFERVTARERSYGGRVSTTWISDDGKPDFFTGLPVYGLTPTVALPEDGWFRVTGHFDDAAAVECGEPADVVWCREQFVVTAVSPVDPPDTVLGGMWRPTSVPPIDGRTEHAMVWTGAEAVIWGGTSSSAAPGQSVFDGNLPRGGAAYDAAADRWRLVPDAPIPGRNAPVTVWTGSEVIVFGGRIGEATRLDGAAWNPTTNAWRAVAGAPLDGNETIGGWLNGRLVIVTSTTTASYDPTTDRWTALPPAPIRVGWRTAVVAGDRLFVVAFGDGATPPVDWAALDPATGTWQNGEVPIDPLMAGTAFVGAGERVVVVATGQTFDPVTLRWRTSSAGCNGAGNGAAWTGRFVIGVVAAWDGLMAACRDLPPAPRRAAPFDQTSGREFAVGVWTGTQYVTWSGGTGGDIVWVPNDGAVFTPAFDLGPCCG